MALYYYNLNQRTRQLMLAELDFDIANNQLHISPFLSGQGQRDYVNLLRQAIQSGSDETLEKDLSAHRRITRALPRKKRTGGFGVAATPRNAAQVLAEGEFNRYYIRALARRAIDDGIQQLIVYRAKRVSRPRAQSEALIESALPPKDLLDDLRSNPDRPPLLGVPGGSSSGLSVRLP